MTMPCACTNHPLMNDIKKIINDAGVVVLADARLSIALMGSEQGEKNTLWAL